METHLVNVIFGYSHIAIRWAGKLPRDLHKKKRSQHGDIIYSRSTLCYKSFFLKNTYNFFPRQIGCKKINHGLFCLTKATEALSKDTIIVV